MPKTAGTLVSDIEELAAGTYLTDGVRLLCVRKLYKGRVVAEEGNVDAPDIVSLPLHEVASSWRRVEFTPYDEDLDAT